MAERRRLPVIQEPKGDAPDDEAEARPRWHWVGFGTVAIFAAWLPLAYAAGAIVKRAIAPWLETIGSAEDLAARLAAMSAGERMRLAAIETLPHLLALGLGAFAGGFVVGRFGRHAGAREGAASGAAVSLIALAAACREGGVTAASLVLVPLAVGFAGWGGRVGARFGNKGRGGPGKAGRSPSTPS